MIRKSIALVIALLATSARLPQQTCAGLIKPHRVVAPLFSWTAFYIGINGGYLTGTAAVTNVKFTDHILRAGINYQF